MTPSGMEPSPLAVPVIAASCPHCGCLLPPIAWPATKHVGHVADTGTLLNPPSDDPRLAETERVSPKTTGSGSVSI